MIDGNAKSQQDTRYLAAARQYGAMIERLARGYEADAELRRDLVQEIHAALWRSFAIFEEQCSERSWVHRIAHNVGVTHILTSRRTR
jgi:RNA polymerase sigma-70 factor (ECF subfamily)